MKCNLIYTVRIGVDSVLSCHWVQGKHCQDKEDDCKGMVGIESQFWSHKVVSGVSNAEKPSSFVAQTSKGQNSDLGIVIMQLLWRYTLGQQLAALMLGGAQCLPGPRVTKSKWFGTTLFYDGCDVKGCNCSTVFISAELQINLHISTYVTYEPNLLRTRHSHTRATGTLFCCTPSGLVIF